MSGILVSEKESFFFLPFFTLSLELGSHVLCGTHHARLSLETWSSVRAYACLF